MNSQTARVVRARMVDGRWELEERDLMEAIEVLKSGGLVVYPTETLYGLGVDPYDEEAINRLYKVKQRPRGDPVAVLVSGLEEAERIAHFSHQALKIWEAFMPGPLTLILKAKPEAPSFVVTRKGALGLRMPKHDVPLNLALEFGPITTSSANIHHGLSPRTLTEALSQLGGQVALYIDAGPCPLGEESTVLDLTLDRAMIKREGVLAREELERYG